MTHVRESVEQALLVAASDRPNTAAASLRSTLRPTSKQNRRLVDYTKCRGDGTSRRNRRSSCYANLVSNPDREFQQQENNSKVLGMPTCRALESTLFDMMVSPSPSSSVGEGEPHREQPEERVDFFLKITPKQYRKVNRVSSLDMVINRRARMDGAINSRKQYSPERRTLSSPPTLLHC